MFTCIVRAISSTLSRSGIHAYRFNYCVETRISTSDFFNFRLDTRTPPVLRRSGTSLKSFSFHLRSTWTTVCSCTPSANAIILSPQSLNLFVRMPPCRKSTIRRAKKLRTLPERSGRAHVLTAVLTIQENNYGEC